MQPFFYVMVDEDKVGLQMAVFCGILFLPYSGAFGVDITAINAICASTPNFLGVGHDACIHECPCHMCSLSAPDWHTSVSLHVFISAFIGDHDRTPSSNLLQVIVCSSEWIGKYPQTESKTRS